MPAYKLRNNFLTNPVKANRNLIDERKYIF
jgi:hypothetical protein